MKILCCQPGASFATADVYDGLVAGFESLGHEVIHYQLDGRIALSASWFKYLHARQKREKGPLANVVPTPADIQYHAGIGLLERALRFEPDWIVVVSAMYLHPDVSILLKRANQRIALVFTESPYDVEHEAKIAPLADVCWTNERTCVSFLCEHNPTTAYLPAAYDPARLAPDRAADEWATPSDVLFVGTGFMERIELLEQIDWTGIDLALYGEWSLLRRNSPLKRFVRGGFTTPAQTMALYRQTKIGLNLYRQSKGFGKDAPRIAYAESLNPRAYELAGAGVLQISDYREELGEVFRASVPNFRTAQECEPLIRFYLADAGRREIAPLQAQYYVQEHTYAKRASQVCDALRARLETRSPVAV